MDCYFEKINKDLLTNPITAEGVVIEGFGRGSKQLGIPTANFPESVVNGLRDNIEPGVYYGWSRVDDDEIYKMVLSIGWNPYYKNKKKSMETHILHEFENDFYGRNLRIVVSGYLRPEMNFDSLDGLIVAIRNDIKEATIALDDPKHFALKGIEFITKT